MAGKKGFGGGSGGILALEIKDEAELYEHYMSFVSGGGLFVPTKKSHELGDDIFFLLTIYLSNEPIPMTGKVVWVTHSGSSSSKREGVGVQFTDEQADLKIQIEQALTGMVQSHQPTLTM
ncbi:MAG: PilZ domain-containing protein [Porticoccaceae bacterium]